MYSSTILLTTLAATVSATIPLHRRYVEARQTDSPSSSADFPTASASALDGAACVSAADDVDSILAAAPTAPDDLYSYAATASDIMTQDPCSLTFPSSLASEWSSYTSAYYSWFSATASAELVSAASACGTTLDASYYGLCSTAATESSSTSTESGSSGLTTSTSGAVTKTTASKSSGTAQATTTSTAGAVAREAGIVGAVFAGVLGAVVAL